MNVLISLLRGINVSGRNIIKMEKLKDLLGSLGLQDVITYIQSGNVVYKTEYSDTEYVSRLISNELKKQLSLDVEVFTKTSGELSGIIRLCPFPALESKSVYITFLNCAAPESGIMQLEKNKSAGDEIFFGPGEIYLKIPGGYGKTKLSNNNIERILKAKATTRNYGTLSKLAEMAAVL